MSRDIHEYLMEEKDLSLSPTSSVNKTARTVGHNMKRVLFVN